MTAFKYLALLVACTAAQGGPLVFEGDDGPGKGKHLVFLAGDHEYRAEETLPALARLLAKHHGFKCTVLFSIDPKTGFIDPASNNLPGTEALQGADLMVNFLRFKNLPDEQMQHVEDYLLAGGAVIGLRTASHGFKFPADSTWNRYDFQSKVAGFERGFGRQVLGDSWSGHHGQNHVLSTRIDPVPEQKDHPFFAGVTSPWAVEGGYWCEPMSNSTVLATAQPLLGMEKDSADSPTHEPSPAVWIRDYRWGEGEEGTGVYVAYGASESLFDEDFRRMLVNGCFYLSGCEEAIRPDLNVDLVGPYRPVTFRGGGHRRGVLPADLAGWDSEILPGEEPPSAKPKKKK